MANGAQPVVKISGYLEKKAKLRIGSPWKKYWFVLEGRLLLYYRSKDEYETLSPCKGSINLCPPCNVKPALSAAGVFQIECRASTVTLRAESRSEQERWMQALLAAIAQSKSSPNRMSHFRYSLDELPVTTSNNQKLENSLSRQNTMPYRISTSPKRDPKDIIGRLQQMGAQTYGGSLGTITKLANKEQKLESPKLSNSSIDITLTPGEEIPTNFKLSHKSESTERIPSMLIENDQYSIIQEENSIDLFLDERSSKPTGRIKSMMLDNDLYKIEDENSNQEKVTSFMLDNDHYIPINEENDFIIRNNNKEIQKSEHLYERISTDSECNNKQECVNKIKYVATNLYERISSSSNNSEIETKINEQYSVIHKEIKDGGSPKAQENEYSLPIQNSEYNDKQERVNKIKYVATNLYERISSSSNNSDIETKINEQYSSIVHKETKDGGSPEAQENEYSLPINEKTIDHNKNSLICDNEQYISTVDDKIKQNLYSDGLLYTPEYIEYAAIDKTKEQEGLYEDPDQLKNQKEQSILYQDIEPILPPRPEQKNSEETSNQTKKSKFKMFGHLMKKSEKNNETTKTKPSRRSTSFIRKVWRRKAKSLDAEDDITYEAVDYELIEKQVAKDKTDIQMLQELQKILETRKNMLQEKLNSGENKNDATKQSTDPILNPKEEGEESLELRTVTASEQRPSLPPRQNSQSLTLHDMAVEESIEKNTPPISASNSKNDLNKICSDNETDLKIKTIDEILEDLDKEKDMQESRQKVKQLIEKFNDYQNEEEVVLRKKSKLELCKSLSDTTVLQKLKKDDFNEKLNRESDELTQLLEELSKVTCAPVLTPGVTSSLITPVLTDDEWLQLIPIRRRRMSDPDYDVPRPHRSLQLHGRTKKLADNPIPATRFFGPILPSSTENNNMVVTDIMTSITSMDPDSLEVENLSSTLVNKGNETTIIEKEKYYTVSSYTSHEYNTQNDDTIVYAQPKAVIFGTKFSDYQDNNIYSNIKFNNKSTINDKSEVNINNIEINNSLKQILTKAEETFIDSLEPLAETSTAF